MQKIVSFGYDRSELPDHHLRGVKAVYKSNRAEILWTLDEIGRFEECAPEYVSRILIAATETGLRPGDLWHLSTFHIRKTPQGRRIEITTAKKRRRAVIPVTERMGRLIDATLIGRERLLTNSRGEVFATENGLGDVVAKWRDNLKIRKVLRLYDARGTAATRLLLAGAEIREIATAMGWSVKRANEVIEFYVAMHPDMTDQLLAKIESFERNM
ncbi:tyrosine-type recombinase/integrase [Falsihalocynthiibacter sp. S25ZX9]|uniref:tyrosine-type recombinase/integrase n=1 Tax=Falsihalocynthiibacter sp. S25ZX9 TaxID=3240870 RepID=UPI00350F1E4D